MELTSTKEKLATETSNGSLPQRRHTRNPLTPSSNTTLVITSIFKRFITWPTSFRAATVSMQGTKKEQPLRNLRQLIRYATVSITILGHSNIQL